MAQKKFDEYIGLFTNKTFVFTILIASIMLLIFVADLQFTAHLYIGVLYIIVVMLSLWLPGTFFTLSFACISTVLSAIGFFYSIYVISPGSYFHIENLINLALTISVIWITTIIAIYIKGISMALHKSETIYKSIMDTSIDPMVIIGKNGIIETASKTIENYFGWNAEEIKGKNFCNLLSPQSQEKYERLIMERENVNNSEMIGQINEAVAIHRMNREFPCEISLNFINIPEINESFFAIALRDISMRKAYEKKLGWISAHDELTKIYNRRHLNEQIDREWHRMLRTQDYLSLIILDVDYFKNYNDTLGHQAGDLCLQKIAICLNESCRRAGDLAARYGGDEFVVLLPNTNMEGAEQIANTIKTKIANLNLAHPNSAASKRVSVSMGVASMIPLMGCSYERLIRFADQALYEAKQAGRNKFCLYQDQNSPSEKV
jgi:diguanylate cyclase (GGDEF)-like protein/PAS domain S-box-containing protein